MKILVLSISFVFGVIFTILLFLLYLFEEIGWIKSCVNQIVKIIFYLLRFPYQIRFSLSLLCTTGVTFCSHSSILSYHLPDSIHGFSGHARRQLRFLALFEHSFWRWALYRIIFGLLNFILNVLSSYWDPKSFLLVFGRLVQTIRIFLCRFSSPNFFFFIFNLLFFTTFCSLFLTIRQLSVLI